MKRKAAQPYQGQYVDPDELFTEEDEPHEAAAPKKSKGWKNKAGGGHGGRAEKDKGNDGSGRTRPTNNQLLYKAYFRWPHYPCYFKPGTAMPLETDACASVTSAFLQVLQTLHEAERTRSAGTPHQRSVLQILSTNTRRTKVVELSSGTHRVPEELKKHYLPDGEGGQYSTNLDRNRYGNDDNYLFTVIRYDLEFLGLCPCMVDVEIIDAKAGNQSVIVSAGPDACTCQHKPEILPFSEHLPAPGMHMLPHGMPAAQQPQAPMQPVYQPAPTPAQPPAQPQPQLVHAPQAQPQQGPGTAKSQHMEPVAAPQPTIRAPRGTPGPSTRSRESPKPSGSGVSQLFDALVMAATGGQDGAAIGPEGLGGEPPVTSAYLNALPGAGLSEQDGAGSRPAGRGPQMHHAPMRNKSRLWSAMSFGDMDSLQNALDAFRAEEEIASQPYNGANAERDAPANNGSEGGLLRQRRRKPPRGNSSFLLRAGDSTLGDLSLSKLGMKFDSEKSGDNQGFDEGTDAAAQLPAESQDDEHAEGGGGTTGDGTDEVGDDREQSERQRSRHVPRQASAVNLSHRVSNAELARLRNELESLRAENKRLKEAQADKGDGDSSTLRTLESDLKATQTEAASHQAARKAAEERLALTSMELSKARHEIQALTAKLVASGAMGPGVGLPAQHAQHMAQLAALAGGPVSASALLAAPTLDPALALAYSGPVAGAAASLAAAAAAQMQNQAVAQHLQQQSTLTALLAAQQRPHLLGAGDVGGRQSGDFLLSGNGGSGGGASAMGGSRVRAGSSH